MKRILILLVTIAACIAAWAAEPYVVYTPSNTTLTFYYGTKPNGAYGLTQGFPGWYNDGTNANVTRVVFDSSFAQARPTSTVGWFRGMEKLESILGLNYLNTSQVTSMSYMFFNCKKLTNLNLSGFNTSNVKSMGYMFSECENLAVLNVSSFNTSNVTDMTVMFRNCKNLTSLDLSSFNTSKATDMQGMFYNCVSLSNLNISSFNTSKLVSMFNMFNGCEHLTTLDLSHFDTSNVKSMAFMFLGCHRLSNLNLSSFDTSKVTSMEKMFVYCYALNTLDLSSFNTSSVTNMKSMFYNCSNLKTVTVSSKWSTSAVTDSEGMFSYCTSLVGGAGTTFSYSHTDASYAHIDGGPSNPGYFTGESEEFDLWINGVQVTNVNCNNLSSIDGVSGTVTYNSLSKTLTLDHARLTCGETSNGGAIRSNIDGLTINVKGTSSIVILPNGTNMNGMMLSNTTITGTDTLGVQGRKSGITILSGKTLTINNLHSLIARGSYGIYASSPTNTRLVVKGGGTNVLATGGSGAIRNMGELVLEDGLRIIEPAGGYFTGGIVYDASGNVATRAAISRLPGDVNGDGDVTSADVTALYDVLLSNDYSSIVNGDQDGDGNITSGDVTAVYSVLLGS